MPARVVLVHDDPVFVEGALAALRNAGHDDVATFPDSMTALGALEAAKRIELLITRVRFPPGQPHGVSLGLMARQKRPGLKVLLLSRPETEEFTKGVGEVLVAPVTSEDVVARVKAMLGDE